jgi:hypothetical protein
VHIATLGAPSLDILRYVILEYFVGVMKKSEFMLVLEEFTGKNCRTTCNKK